MVFRFLLRSERMSSSSQGFWQLLSEDAALAHGVQRELAQPLQRVSWAETRRIRQGQFFLLDLRDDARWEQLPQFCKELRQDRPMGTVVVVGLVHRGVPLAQLTRADQYLTAVVDLAGMPAWCSRHSAEKLLAQEASLAARRTSEYRQLPVHAGCRMFTYVPDLFTLFEELPVAARHDVTILLTGQTGTGKTTLAQAIHRMSNRAKAPFVHVACGGLAKELIDSELFGHVRGAFTGADRDKVGKFQLAEGGTILLDEIEVLGQAQQAKLLRVLETGEFEPVGSNRTIRANVRIIAASNVDLEQWIQQGQFRADLYFRLKQLVFHLPPLVERPQDVVPLAQGIIEETARDFQTSVRWVEPRLLEVLRLHRWPGNIRELRNEMRRAVMFCREGVVRVESLSPGLAHLELPPEQNAPSAKLSTQLALTEREKIEQMLRLHNFNRTAAAKALGISRVTLYNKIRKYNIPLQNLPPGNGDSPRQ